MRNNILLFIALCAISAITLAGCGGDSAPPAAGASVNKGVVTAEGNIAVNGYFYNISSASIVIDGVSGTKSSLKAGMVVTVSGIFDNRTSHAIRRTATRVVYDSDFQGPVDCVNLLANSLTIMGQQVLIKTDAPNQTVFANFSGVSTIFANFSTIDKLNHRLSPDFTSQPPLYSMVRVSGFSNGANGFLATRIELLKEGVDLAAGFPIGIRGTIGGVDVEGMAFTIGNLTVDYSAMDPAYIPISAPNPSAPKQLPGTSLAGGKFVIVKGSSADFEPGNAPTYVAQDGSFHLGNGMISAHNGDHVTVAGFVSGLTGSSFTVGETPVDASILSTSGISNANFLEVEGTFNNGVLVASRVRLF